MKIYLVVTALLLICEARDLKLPNGGIFDNDRIEEAKEKKDIFEINQGIKGLVHGDVIPRKSKDTRNTVRDDQYQWPTTNIPFVYSPLVSLEAIGSIELARQEYKLRTCLNFYERTDEENFIRFISGSGCYSSVGMVGGSQTVSIGSGCERMAVCCHELMHAIGIWHEQSRADRDDYVQIMWDVIREGYENNFNKYDWEITDARRVPYDYNSIMHYSDGGFSTNGDPTIVTRDPEFQDVIGQRLTFSKGDTDKINRLYKCSDTLLYSYNCNYDEEAACGYMQDYDTDDIDWIRYDIGDKSLTVSPNAPSVDATLGVAGKGSYMILDNSGKSAAQMGEMRSMRFVTKSAVQCLKFSYYANIQDITGSAGITAHLATLDDLTGEVLDYGAAIFTVDSDTGSKWKFYRMSINAPSAYRIVFRGKTGPTDQDVIAIDDVSVQDKPCEDDYFVIENYSNILETFTKGESIESPVLHSDEGYDFKVKVYPVGTTSSADGYMGMYFGLVAGPNDDELNWPFCNKYIRLMVVDQSDNPLYSLNKYAEYLTTQEAGGDLWNKPNETQDDPAGYYGYSNFMPVGDVVNTHHYLKHDSIMVSVLVKDMNWVNDEVCNGTFTRSTGKSAKALENGGQPGIDYIDGYPEKDEHHDDDHHEQHNDNNDDGHDHNDDDHHEHHDDHDDEHHEHHHDHDDDHHEHHEEHYEDNHDDNHQAMIPVGTAAGMAVGSATFVFLVMATVLCCVQKSHKQNMKHVANNISLHTSTPVPPAYPTDGKIVFEPLPEKI